MENDYLQGHGAYPKTMATAFNLLVNWKQDPRNLMHSVGVTNDGVSFANIEGGWDEDDEGITMATSGSSIFFLSSAATIAWIPGSCPKLALIASRTLTNDRNCS